MRTEVVCALSAPTCPASTDVCVTMSKPLCDSDTAHTASVDGVRDFAQHTLYVLRPSTTAFHLLPQATTLSLVLAPCTYPLSFACGVRLGKVGCARVSPLRWSSSSTHALSRAALLLLDVAGAADNSVVARVRRGRRHLWCAVCARCALCGGLCHPRGRVCPWGNIPCACAIGACAGAAD